MTIDSKYQIPIFVSSTEYNLVDLRAELANYLDNLGYRPILSSSEGFPDKSPDLEPWESCLPVIDKCFVMVLIIDGRYGKPMQWPHYSSVFRDKEVSPTHGEYLYAMSMNMRILVYVRRTVMEFYQSYRKVMKECNDDPEKAKKVLQPTLPDTIEFNTLHFYSEVKTTKPIPWIVPFDNVSDIKQEIHKKMMNDLAEVYLIRADHHQTIIKKFVEILGSFPEDEREQVLESIGYTKDLIKDIENLKSEKSKIELQLEKTKKEMIQLQTKFDKNKDNKTRAAALLEKYRDLQKDSFSYANTMRRIDNSIASTLSNTPTNSEAYQKYMTYLYSDSCKSCGKPRKGLLGLGSYTCPQCFAYYCGECSDTKGISGTTKCPSCGLRTDLD